MSEAKTVYVEPIKGEIIAETAGMDAKSESVAENTILPEGLAEDKTETHGENEVLYQKILASAASSKASTVHSDAQVQHDAAQVSAQTDADSKVTQLVDLASTKGVVYAVKVARSLNDFYVLDQMHDGLVGKFYESLKAKGLISEE